MIAEKNPASEIAELPDNLKCAYDALVKRFLERVKSDDSNFNADRYWKWTHTGHVAGDCDVSNEVCRERLSKLEEMGLVGSKRSRNWILWSAKFIEGFRPHNQFHDYVERAI